MKSHHGASAANQTCRGKYIDCAHIRIYQHLPIHPSIHPSSMYPMYLLAHPTHRAGGREKKSPSTTTPPNRKHTQIPSIFQQPLFAKGDCIRSILDTPSLGAVGKFPPRRGESPNNPPLVLPGSVCSVLTLVIHRSSTYLPYVLEVPYLRSMPVNMASYRTISSRMGLRADLINIYMTERERGREGGRERKGMDE
jgi:hypothetical protein